MLYDYGFDYEQEPQPEPEPTNMFENLLDSGLLLEGQSFEEWCDDAYPCCDGSHDWKQSYHLFGGALENPGVWGHGGGVVSKLVCCKCGCVATHDTWADDEEGGIGEYVEIYGGIAPDDMPGDLE